MLSGFRTDIHDIICRQHRILVVLHHNERISQIPETFQRVDQFIIVSLVKTDARLIQNVRHSHQTGADLGSQTDTLGFSAGQGSRRLGETQIVKSHIV